MTNYNERLDKIITNVSGKSFDAAINNPNDYAQVVIDAEAEAKQAITSLIKELVAEAKPKEMDSFYEKPIVDQFEQNLLKALEEV